MTFSPPLYAANDLAYLPTPLVQYAPSTPLPAVSARKTRPTIALALGGGGVRGAAHVGVVKIFERENLPIDFIAGSSMGAIVGGLYAAGVSLDSIDQMFRDRPLFKAFSPMPDTIKLMTVPTSMIGTRSTNSCNTTISTFCLSHPSDWATRSSLLSSRTYSPE